MAIAKHINPRLYRIWAMMRQRCTNRNHIAYARYGARGISVCGEWREFAPFERWAFMAGYQDTLTLDRVDGLRGYEPNNCRWVTPHLQARNMRSNVNIEIDGVTMCATDWARSSGIKVGCVLRRYHLGWRGRDLLLPPDKARKVLVQVKSK